MESEQYQEPAEAFLIARIAVGSGSWGISTDAESEGETGHMRHRNICVHTKTNEPHVSSHTPHMSYCSAQVLCCSLAKLKALNKVYLPGNRNGYKRNLVF